MKSPYGSCRISATIEVSGFLRNNTTMFFIGPRSSFLAAPVGSPTNWGRSGGNGSGKRHSGCARDLIEYGADRCVVVEHPALAYYQTCTYTHALSELVRQYKPNILLIAATHLGSDLAPRVSRRLGLGLTADCTRLSIDPEEQTPLQTRPAFGGNIMATIVSRFSRPQTATVRPGIMKALDWDPSRHGEVRIEEIEHGWLSGVHQGSRMCHERRQRSEFTSCKDYCGRGPTDML